MSNKSLIRQFLIKRRKALNPGIVAEKSVLIAQHFLSHPMFMQAQHIACYLPYSGEVDTEAIVQALWQRGRRCYLPILQADKADYSLSFGLYHEATRLEKNRYGIAQPPFDPATSMPAYALDLVLMPLVAYDKRGSRLGMGAGFYDRAFSFKQQAQMSKPWLIGLAYDFQQVNHVFTEAWDVGLDGVITESGLHLFDRLTE